MRWRYFTCCAVLVAGCGWGSHAQPVDVPVTGAVTLDSRPLAGAVVTFDSDEPAARAMLVGVCDDGGKFRMQTATTQTSAYTGKYRVTISKMLKPDGSPVGPDETPAEVLARESLPPRYSSPSVTELEANVAEAGGDFEFRLTSR